jgi:hypothetical protein
VVAGADLPHWGKGDGMTRPTRLAVPLVFLGASLGLLVTAPPALADQEVSGACPAEGDPYIITVCYDSAGRETSRTKTDKPFAGGEDVNGDGKKDRKLTEIPDAEGNKIECWCVQKSDKTAQQFYYAFVTKGGRRSWFGGCYFPWGRNSMQCLGTIETSGSDKGKYKRYDGVCQANIQYRPSGPNSVPTGTNDKIFYHVNKGPNTGKNVKYLTKGYWKAVGTNKYEYVTTETKQCPVKDPPRVPHDLVSVNPDNPNNGIHTPRSVLVANTDNLPQWEYRLIAAPLVLADDVDPETEIETTFRLDIQPGDAIVITGEALNNPSVCCEAALPQFGAWRVASADNEHVRYEATVPAVMEGTHDLGFTGFRFFSPAPEGQIRYAFFGENAGDSMVTVGPSFINGIGACCDLPRGTCAEEVFAIDCLGEGFQFGGDGSTCPDVNCPPVPLGACCDTLYGSCADSVPGIDCTDEGLLWSEGQLCENVPCAGPPSGACCLLDVGCMDGYTRPACEGQQGIYHAGQLCADIACDCNANGVPDDLDISNGTSRDDNGNGVPDECEQLAVPAVTNSGRVALALVLLTTGLAGAWVLLRRRTPTAN